MTPDHPPPPPPVHHPPEKNKGTPLPVVRRGLRTRIKTLLDSRRILLWTAVISFLENTVLFVGVEPLFIALLAARRDIAYRLATMLLAGSVAGAVAMYALGAFLYGPVVEPALEALGQKEAIDGIKEDLLTEELISLFLIGILPIPFQLATVGAGVLQMPFLPFLAVVTASRFVRYFGLTTLILLVSRSVIWGLRKHKWAIRIAGLALLVLAGLVWYLT